MKFSIWDILSVVMLFATVIVVMVVAQIFLDPRSGINPFPPPTMPAPLVLPTQTHTPISPLRLPPTWTPTVVKATLETAASPTALKATITPLPTSTGFVVPTWTPTITPTVTPTITRTPSVTPTPTQTSIPFAVVSVQMGIDTAAFSGACPPGHVYTFIATIFTNTSGKVKYHWEFSDGNKGGVQELNFSSGTGQSVSTTWNVGASGKPGADATYNGWAQIYIDEPNHQSFSKQGFALTCTP